MDKRLAVALALIALSLAAIWFVRGGDFHRRAEGRKDEGAETPRETSVADPQGPTEPKNSLLPPFRPSVNPQPPGGPELDRARSDAIRAALHALLAGAPAAPSSPAPPAFERPTMPSGDGGALADYIRDRVHEDLFPLAKECYARALEKNPKLAGKLIVSFTIAGDRRVGGVVDSAKVEPSSTLLDPEVSDCVKESMMSVSFDAPPDGEASVTVTYPILFLPGDEPDAS